MAMLLTNLTMGTANQTNNSHGDDYEDFYFDGIFFQEDYDTLLIMLGIMIICTNGLVLFLVTQKTYLRTESNCFLISLACSDFLTGLLLIPLNIGCNVTLNPEVCLSSNIITRLIYISTMFHMFSATIEKYICVLHPFKHPHIVTMQRVLFTIAGIWVTSFLLSVIQLSWLPLSDIEPTDYESEKERKIELIYSFFLFVFCFIIPVMIVICCDVIMFKEIKRQVREIQSQLHAMNNGMLLQNAEHKKARHRSQLKAEHRAIAIFVGMLVLFSLLWLPYQSLYFYTYFSAQSGDGSLDDSWFVKFGDAVDFVKFFSSLFNPLLYTFLKKDFRMSFRSVILKQKQSPYDASMFTVLS